MKRLGFLNILILTLLVSCTRDFNAVDGPLEVGFYAGCGSGTVTRTISGGSEKLSSSWQEGDILSLWAFSGNGGKVLDGQKFNAYGIGSSDALFTSTLDNMMPDGEYEYVAAYPAPLDIKADIAYFSIPAEQDGRSGRGEDIMVSDAAHGGPLKSIDWLSGFSDELHLQMNHLLHRFRFYIDSPLFDGEPIQSMTVEFPRPVAGNLSVDIRDPHSVSFSGEDKVLDITLAEPVPVSTTSSRHYVTASIAPTSFEAGDEMLVTVYTETKTAISRIPLGSRSFEAGHSTPVRVVPSSIEGSCRLKFRLLSNKLGEQLSTITVKAPAGCKLGNTASNSITLKYGKDISVGGTFGLDFDDVNVFRNLGGKQLEIKYETVHLTTSETIVVPDLSSKSVAVLDLKAPCLLEEDFSSVPSFSSDDTYQVLTTGSKDYYSFLNGWTGARIGASAGECIRLACRRETSADYDARVESAPLNATFKSEVVLKVSFDYGAAEEHGGILSQAVGQNCYIGYVTSLSGYKSDSTSGEYDRENNSFYVNESSGSYSNTPNHAEYYIKVKNGADPVRISWRTEVEHMAGMNNNTVWLYIDNVKVEVSE